MQAVVLGNITLDVICQTIDEVPRHESISFENVVISPGGCGTNVAVGLAMSGIPTALIGKVGDDPAALMIAQYLKRTSLDLRYVRTDRAHPTAVSVGLVDSDAQPRFIHTPGANAFVTADDLNIAALVHDGARILHIGGYFVLPGLLDERLASSLSEARSAGILTSLDVVQNVLMGEQKHVGQLWQCMPHLDYFLCNADEGRRLTGIKDYKEAAKALRHRGARTVIVKLGADGCWLDAEGITASIPAVKINVLDTTGAGDAFAAGLIAAILQGKDIRAACLAGNAAGARIAQTRGALEGWFTQVRQ